MITLAIKHKVYADDQFLGHYYGSTLDTVINKAVSANYIYHPEILNSTTKFTTRKGVMGKTIVSSWSDFPHLCNQWSVVGV